MRLFVAINLPDDVRHAIVRAAEPLRQPGLPVKWVEAAGIHLTLKFLGEVDAGREPAVRAALADACAPARRFQLPIAGFGAFPTPARPRVVWVGCEPVPALELLQHGVETAFATLGFPVEGRPFRPHLTLGRAKRDVRTRVPGLADVLSRLSFTAAVAVESVELMESRLSPAGAQYAVRHRVPLEAT
ncbi:MAG: RNA 2',3'-cyclic phosphodiesterase [Gemmatimonadota bacterium]|nr:RNA 2',3'-cyclic phosphodiesterase [Gemmatimonadota bacterium]